jgi:hypothetical protein
MERAAACLPVEHCLESNVESNEAFSVFGSQTPFAAPKV